MTTETHTTIIIDVSGSHRRLVHETEAFLSEEGGDGRFSVWVFNTKIVQLAENIKSTGVLRLLDEYHRPYGSTALYDAVGGVVSRSPPGERIVIITDGEDTKSVEWTYERMVKIINRSGCEMVYIGCGIADYRTIKPRHVDVLRSTPPTRTINTARNSNIFINSDDKSPVMYSSGSSTDS